jgi:MEMO1 family protein
MDTRVPAVEGRFYPSSKKEIEGLIEQIEQRDRYVEFKKTGIEVIGAVLPHAGHVYSGYQCIPFFKYIRNSEIIPETIIILNPNHSGFGAPIALDANKKWKNALGTLKIDKELGKLLSYPEDSRAHDNEHSCEVILPFIQYYLSDSEIQILPISMRSQSALEAEKLAAELYQAVRDTDRKVLIIASSDFSHFLSAEEGDQQDQYILDQLTLRNVGGVEQVVNEHRISACGTGPIMTLMAYSMLVTRDYKSEILARGHSGEVSPSDSVVNYISILFYDES